MADSDNDDAALCAFMDEWERTNENLLQNQQIVKEEATATAPTTNDNARFYDTNVEESVRGLDTATGELVSPDDAIKGRRYICLVCGDPIHLKAGNIRRKHFAHFPNSACGLFSGGESEIHLYAKTLLKRFLDNGGVINVGAAGECHGVTIFGRCGSILHKSIAIVKKDETDSVTLEFAWPDREWIADVAIHNGDCVRYILEIRNTHATNNLRPEPWFEFEAEQVLGISGTQVHLYDVREDRKIYCNNCALTGQPWLLKIPKIPFERKSDGTYQDLPGPWPCIVCGRYRYSKVWEKGKRQCCVICLGNRTEDVKRALGLV